MKQKTIFIFLFLLSMASVVFAAQKQKCTLHIQGLFSRAGVATVQEALFSVAGVQSVDMNLDQQSAVVVYNPEKTSPEALIQAVKATDQYSAFVQN